MTYHPALPRRITLAVIMVAALLGMQAGPALAHAVLMQSTPAEGATVHGTRIPVSLLYNSRIDAARSRVTLEGANPRTAPLTLSAPKPDQLAGSAELVPGAYVLHWQVLAVDGHITRGDVRFTVAE